jgi:hypothetical protein
MLVSVQTARRRRDNTDQKSAGVGLGLTGIRRDVTLLSDSEMSSGKSSRRAIGDMTILDGMAVRKWMRQVAIKSAFLTRTLELGVISSASRYAQRIVGAGKGRLGGEHGGPQSGERDTRGRRGEKDRAGGADEG